MGWVRISDDFYDHPKFAEAGPLGMALWAAGLGWCNRNLTDGHIPRSRARALLDFEGIALVNGMSGQDVTADAVIGLLVEVGLWDETDSGYVYHDYHDYQPTSQQIQAKRLDISSKRREAGRKGGLAAQTQNRRPPEANKQKAEQPSSNGAGTGTTKCLSKSEAPIPIPNLNQDLLPTHEGRGERPQDQDHEPSPWPTHPPAVQQLIDRWLTTLEHPSPAARADAHRWIPHLASILDTAIIDELIGAATQVTPPPRRITYLVASCRDFTRRNMPGTTIADPPSRMAPSHAGGAS